MSHSLLAVDLGIEKLSLPSTVCYYVLRSYNFLTNGILNDFSLYTNDILNGFSLYTNDILNGFSSY